jgi:hypothetical protein
MDLQMLTDLFQRFRLPCFINEVHQGFSLHLGQVATIERTF